MVLLPGITGTRLRNSETGKLVWGNGRSVFRPKDGGRGVSLSLSAGPDTPDGIVPAGMEMMDQLALRAAEAFAGALLKRKPTDVNPFELLEMVARAQSERHAPEGARLSGGLRPVGIRGRAA